MKTAFFALLVVVSAACYVSASVRQNFLPVEELRESPNMKHPQEPAHNVFSKAPVVPFLPMCVAEGYFRDPYNCGKFYHCTGRNAVPDAFYCQKPGYIFDMTTSRCADPIFVDC